MEYLLGNPWLIWTIVGVFFLAIELATTALVSIWFVLAAAVTAVVSVYLDSFVWQFVIFAVLSAVFMAAFRIVYKKYWKKEKTPLKPEDKLIGKTVSVTEKTDGCGGKVLAGDVYWRAETDDGSVIEKDETAVIKAVQGTTLIIKK